ncbi:U6 snRNA-associated Sm-like protein LSm4 isoform 2-T2 [Spheniscus humboldti]
MARGGGGRAAPAPGGGCLLRGRPERGSEGSLAPSLPASRAKEQPSRSKDGDKFWRMPECYIRGSTIKYLRIPDEIIDMVKEEVVSKGRGRGGMQQQKQQKGRGVGGAGRGVFGGRGRGIPGSGRGQQEKKPGRQSAKQ